MVNPNQPDLGSVYALPLRGDKSAPGRWGVVQVVALGDRADLGHGPVTLGKLWGCAVIGFDAVFDNPPQIAELDEVLVSDPVSILTVVTFAHSDIHWELVGYSPVRVKVPVPLYGLCVEQLERCVCTNVISGEEFDIPLTEGDGVFNLGTSTAPVVSDALIIAMEVEPEYSALLKEIADPKYFYDGVASRLRLLDY